MQYRVIQIIEIFLGSRISKFLRPAQRYDDFKLIRITCQAACHGKTEHGIFVKFKKPSKTAVVLIAGVTISGTPCPRHIIVPFGAEAPSGHAAQAWAIPPPSWGGMAGWLNNMDHPRWLYKNGTSYHLVPKHLRATRPRPEQSHLLPEVVWQDHPMI